MTPHRNSGLFSDHYLNETLPQMADWQALAAAHAYRPANRRGALDQPLPAGGDHGRDAALDAEFIHDLAQLILNGGLAEVQLRPNLPVDRAISLSHM